MIALVLFFVLTYLAGKASTFRATLDDTAALMAGKHGEASVEFYRERLEPAWLQPLVITVYIAMALVVLWFAFNYRIELAIEMAFGTILLERTANMILPPGRGAEFYLDLAQAAVDRCNADAERCGDERAKMAAAKATDALAIIREPPPLEPWRREYYEH